MLVVETIARIRRDHLVRGVPIKKIARDLRVSKNTVRKVVRGDETSYSYARKIQPLPKLGPWVGELERRLEANEKKPRRDRLSLLRIHEDLAALGYGGFTPRSARRYTKPPASPLLAIGTTSVVPLRWGPFCTPIGGHLWTPPLMQAFL